MSKGDREPHEGHERDEYVESVECRRLEASGPVEEDDEETGVGGKVGELNEDDRNSELPPSVELACIFPAEVLTLLHEHRLR